MTDQQQLDAQRQLIWAASLEDHLRELARRPALAHHLPATIRELDTDRTPWAYGPDTLVRAAIALIRTRTLGD